MTDATAAAVSLGGVVLGWFLGDLTARRSAREQRQYEERRARRERQVDVAAQLHAEIVELMKITPQGQMDPSAAREPLATAHRRLLDAETRSAVLAEPEITARMRSLEVVIFIAEGDLNKKEPINFWPLTFGLEDLHRALAAYQRGEDLPEPNLPPMGKLSELAWPEGRAEGIEGVMRYLLGEQAKRARAEEQGGSDAT